MNIVLITVFYIMLVTGIDGLSLKRSASVNGDAKELTGLLEKIWSLKPSIVKHADPILSCELIDKCCKGENRAKASLLMSQEMLTPNDHLANKIMAMCVNSSTSTQIDRACSATMKSRISDEKVENDPAVREYVNIIDDHNGGMEMLPRWFARSCNNEHLQALVCLSNTTLVETCARDVLQMALDDDYIDYEELIITVKRVLNSIIENLSKKFGKNAEKQ